MIGIRINKIAKNREASAFSLIEVIVSVALFIIIMLSATEIFKIVIDSQRSAMATQNVQESLKYFLEVTEKEIRMAQKDEDKICGTLIPDGKVFAVSTNALGDVLSFKNYYDECVTYSLVADGESQRFQVSRGAGLTDFISPSKINIDALHFVVNEDPLKQPLVTLNLRAFALGSAQFRSEIDIQTSLSSRYYKN